MLKVHFTSVCGAPPPQPQPWTSLLITCSQRLPQAGPHHYSWRTISIHQSDEWHHEFQGPNSWLLTTFRCCCLIFTLHVSCWGGLMIWVQHSLQTDTDFIIPNVITLSKYMNKWLIVFCTGPLILVQMEGGWWDLGLSGEAGGLMKLSSGTQRGPDRNSLLLWANQLLPLLGPYKEAGSVTFTFGLDGPQQHGTCPVCQLMSQLAVNTVLLYSDFCVIIRHVCEFQIRIKRQNLKPWSCLNCVTDQCWTGETQFDIKLI